MTLLIVNHCIKLITYFSFQSEDTLKYKGLLQEIDDQLSIEELCAVLQGENTLAKRCQR